MTTLQLIRKYPDVPAQILKDYKEPDTHLWVNINDRDITPIRIDLPECPEYHKIEGFGLPAREQKWRPPKLPRRLAELQKDDRFETIDQLWKFLDENTDYYQEEIKFIEQAWDKRLHGMWLFINGKPTYIDGWHYFYIGWYKIDVGLPKYRDRDMKWFLFARMIYTDTRIFSELDKDGYAVPDKDGNYHFLDTGFRVHFGFNYPKHRREGATYRSECINYEIISRTLSAWGGIQSMNDTSAFKAFYKHLVSPWKKLPFFFKPNYEGSTDPKAALSFNPPAERLSSRGSKISSAVGLESRIDFMPADRSAYDGDKLYFHHDDEVGKLKNENCWDRHMVVKECLVIGSTIVGFTIKTSTVGEMEKGGGRMFQHQCKMSDFYRRNLNGQTISGLVTLFFPAYEGLEGFIGPYGESIIDTPTPEQAAFIGKKYGAREFILNSRKGYIDEGDFEGLSEQIRLYPINFRECFRTAARSSGFNLRKLEERIDALRFEKNKITKRGDFVWKDNIRDTEVLFVENPRGRFIVSHQLNVDEANQKRWDEIEETWIPLNTHWGIAGSDPFKFQKTESKRKSDGAGAVIRKGKLKDADFTMKRRFVCTYSNRLYDKFLYAEDMLMMCIYYGIQMNPEINVEFLWDYFESRGYKGYLLYRFDIRTHKMRQTPGSSTNEKIKQDIFIEWMTFIENEIDEEVHLEVLEECRDIGGPEEMTLFDLFTAGGYALIGTNPLYDEIQKLDDEMLDIGRVFKKRTYKIN